MNIQVPNLNANNLAKHAPVDSVMTTELALKLLETNHLVVAWDNTQDDETPFYYCGYLSKVSYSSENKRGNKTVYTIQVCTGTSISGAHLDFDHIAPVDDKSCPKVFYNDGKSQSVGHLIGLRSSGLDDQDCIILVPPFDKKLLMTVPQSKVVFTDNIKLGLAVREEEAKENADNA